MQQLGPAPCPIWGTPADLLRVEDYESILTFNSPRAGGRFVLHKLETDELFELIADEKMKLSTWLVDENRYGQTPKIDKGVLERIKHLRKLTVAARMDRLLQFIARSQNAIAEYVLMQEGYPHAGVSLGDNAGLALASSESSDSRECDYLFRALSDSRLLDHSTHSSLRRIHCGEPRRR